jgi:uncharacterized protein YcfJ
MKRLAAVLALIVALAVVSACAGPDSNRYNAQRGAAIGAGVGAGFGQVIGRNTEATLIGAGVGTLIGAIIGNAVDQSNLASHEAAMTNKRIVYYDDQGGAVEATPIPPGQDQSTNCRKVTKRVWENGRLVSETVDEVCEGEKYTREY